jgi:hypothetical protein
MSFRERLVDRLEILGELMGSLWSAIFADSEVKLARQSAFVGHIAYYVFLQAMTSFTARLVGTTTLPLNVVLAIVYFGLAIYSLIYLLRLLEGMARPFQRFFFPEGMAPDTSSRGQFWFSLGGILVYLAAGNTISYGVGQVLSELAKFEGPAIEAPVQAAGSDSIDIAPSGIPKCYRTLCL